MKLPLNVNPLPEPPEDAPLLNWALYHASHGRPVFPLQPRRKDPLPGSNGHKDATLDEGKIRDWWRQIPDANIGMRCDGLVVFDDDGGGMPPEINLPTTLTFVTGSGGTHHLYAAEPDSLASHLTVGARIFGKESPHHIDLRANKAGYLVAPGSIHPNGGRYTIVPGVQRPVVLTDDLVRTLLVYGARFKGMANRIVGDKGVLVKIDRDTSPAGDETKLVWLLNNPPDEGGRNDWLIRVAGHYARQFRWAEDSFLEHLESANLRLAQPLDEAEVAKVAASAWTTEHVNHPERGATSDTGMLAPVSGKNRIHVAHKDEDTGTIHLVEYGNFDMRALGVNQDPNGRREMLVRLTVDHPGGAQNYDIVIRGGDYDSKRIHTLLAYYGASVVPAARPVGDIPVGLRLLRYLESQNPRPMELRQHYGWVDGAAGYLVPGGVITHSGFTVTDQAETIADPARVQDAGYRYGFKGTPDEALDVLREVLTYQDPAITSVYGAWWAAVLCKHWVIKYTGYFPFMVIDAPSESGKTNGFFGLMHQLSGSTKTGQVMTTAAARNSASQNASGIVWVDDMDSTAQLGELLRAATSMGELSKSNVDHTGNALYQIVSAMQVSGESTGFHTEKALRDRSVKLSPASPTDRRSTKGDWAQWEDIKSLQRQYPREDGGLAQVSGHILQRLASPKVKAIIDATQKTASATARKGRRGASDEVLYIGARILDWLLDSGTEHAENVDTYLHVAKQGAGGDEFKDENALTLKVLPELLRHLNFPAQVEMSERPELQGWARTPVVISRNKPGDLFDDGVSIDFHVGEVAALWRKIQHGRIKERTETADSLRSQMTALGCGKITKRVVDSEVRTTYRRLTGPVAAEVYRRATEG